MADNRCVRIYDLKQKVKYHPEIGTYVSEEDIDLMERVFVDGGKVEVVMAKPMSEVLEEIQDKQELRGRHFVEPPPLPQAPPLRVLREGFRQ